MKASRMVANIVGPMLLVQVILGGAATVLNFPIGYHLVWGILTFVVLIVATVLALREYSTKSTVFRIGAVAIVDYVIQGVLGLAAFNSDDVVVVHLANAFVLGALATYLISATVSASKVPVQPAIQTS